MKHFRLTITVALALALLAWGIFEMFNGSDRQTLVTGDNPDVPTLVFYTTGLATTPQLPLWAAVDQGKLKGVCNLDVRQWKDVDDLRGVVLAGKGDLWLGHLEGFAQAARHGAPVSVLVVTGWRKIYLVSRDSQCKGLADFAGRELAMTPVGSPAAPILKALWPKDLQPVDLVGFEPKQLALSFMQGKLDSALVPEPMVTVLLHKVPGLRVVQSLEVEYGRLSGGEARVPLAGLAINSRTAQKYPGLADKLTDILAETGRELAKDPEAGIAALPQSFGKFVSQQMVRESLKRDLILVEPACAVKGEIARFLAMVYPPSVGNSGELVLGDKFLWPYCEK